MLYLKLILPQDPKGLVLFPELGCIKMAEQVLNEGENYLHTLGAKRPTSQFSPNIMKIFNHSAEKSKNFTVNGYIPTT